MMAPHSLVGMASHMVFQQTLHLLQLQLEFINSLLNSLALLPLDSPTNSAMSNLDSVLLPHLFLPRFLVLYQPIFLYLKISDITIVVIIVITVNMPLNKRRALLKMLIKVKLHLSKKFLPSSNQLIATLRFIFG